VFTAKTDRRYNSNVKKIRVYAITAVSIWVSVRINSKNHNSNKIFVVKRWKGVNTVSESPCMCIYYVYVAYNIIMYMYIVLRSHRSAAAFYGDDVGRRAGERRWACAASVGSYTHTHTHTHIHTHARARAHPYTHTHNTRALAHTPP